MNVQLHLFQTPNFVIMVMPPGVRQDGFKEAPSLPLNAIPADDLADLCDAFRIEVFTKANLTDPRIRGRCTCNCGKVVDNAWRDSDGHHCLTCLAAQRDALRPPTDE